MRIVLGGIGGDSHSVGLTLLRFALRSRGHLVKYLGIQCHVREFFAHTAFADFVLLSNMDGHAMLYLKDFVELRKQFPNDAIWYLGGNLSVSKSHGYERDFINMGFRRVFAKTSRLHEILDSLDIDFAGREARTEVGEEWERESAIALDDGHQLCPGKLTLRDFGFTREAVLSQWGTGRAAENLRENARFLKLQNNFAELQLKSAMGRRDPLVQPRTGVATVANQRRLFRELLRAGADVLSYQVDSLTRNNDYATVEEVLESGPRVADVTLNGFPVVNHGVASLRQLSEALQVPLQVRHSTRDPRLLAEISLAGGVTAFEGGAICYNVPYYKDYPLSESINQWKYVDRLVGLYSEAFGVVIDREFFGVLTGTLVPPSLAIAVNVLEALLAVTQGVRSVSVGYAEQGNRVQDLAALEVLREITETWLAGSGHGSVQVNTVFHQYMAAFPLDHSKARQLISASATTAKLGQATRILTKTPVEAINIPTAEDNALGVRLTRQGFDAASQELITRQQIEQEKQVIGTEVEAILHSILALGSGDIEIGIVRGFARGIIDIPFVPSIYNRGEVQTARDVDGAIRYLDTGSLPFSKDIIAFHREKMNARRSRDLKGGLGRDVVLIEQDLLRVPMGEFERWPLEN